jgi:hypothetical protein
LEPDAKPEFLNFKFTQFSDAPGLETIAPGELAKRAPQNRAGILVSKFLGETLP